MGTFADPFSSAALSSSDDSPAPLEGERMGENLFPLSPSVLCEGEPVLPGVLGVIKLMRSACTLEFRVSFRTLGSRVPLPRPPPLPTAAAHSSLKEGLRWISPELRLLLLSPETATEPATEHGGED